VGAHTPKDDKKSIIQSLTVLHRVNCPPNYDKQNGRHLLVVQVLRHEVESTSAFAPCLVPLIRCRRTEGARKRVQGASQMVVGDGGERVGETQLRRFAWRRVSSPCLSCVEWGEFTRAQADSSFLRTSVFCNVARCWTVTQYAPRLRPRCPTRTWIQTTCPPALAGDLPMTLAVEGRSSRRVVTSTYPCIAAPVGRSVRSAASPTESRSRGSGRDWWAAMKSTCPSSTSSIAEVRSRGKFSARIFIARRACVADELIF
jgi:hypothetical protein